MGHDAVCSHGAWAYECMGILKPEMTVWRNLQCLLWIMWARTWRHKGLIVTVGQCILLWRKSKQSFTFTCAAVEREKQSLEKQLAELRVHLNFNAMASELEEVKRCMQRKDQEKARLETKIEVMSSLYSLFSRQFYLPELLKEIVIRSRIILMGSFGGEW